LPERSISIIDLSFVDTILPAVNEGVAIEWV
jgi:hypothetical protein